MGLFVSVKYFRGKNLEKGSHPFDRECFPSYTYEKKSIVTVR